MSEPHGPDVGYTLKEVIEKLDRKIDAMFTVLNLKADRADLTALDHRVDTLERRVESDQTARNATRSAQRERQEHWRWLLPLLVAITGVVLAVVLHGGAL